MYERKYAAQPQRTQNKRIQNLGPVQSKCREQKGPRFFAPPPPPTPNDENNQCNVQVPQYQDPQCIVSSQPSRYQNKQNNNIKSPDSRSCSPPNPMSFNNRRFIAQERPFTRNSQVPQKPPRNSKTPECQNDQKMSPTIYDVPQTPQNGQRAPPQVVGCLLKTPQSQNVQKMYPGFSTRKMYDAPQVQYSPDSCPKSPSPRVVGSTMKPLTPQNCQRAPPQVVGCLLKTPESRNVQKLSPGFSTRKIYDVPQVQRSPESCPKANSPKVVGGTLKQPTLQNGQAPHQPPRVVGCLLKTPESQNFQKMSPGFSTRKMYDVPQVQYSPDSCQQKSGPAPTCNLPRTSTPKRENWG